MNSPCPPEHPFSFSTAFFLAAQHGHGNIVRRPLDKGADPNVKTDNGGTPLMLASQQDYREIMQTLEDAGARE
jgi:ankyrin repeat protein